MKKNILICIGLYIPGNKGGGPIRSISNIVSELGDEYNIYILTGDRDLGDLEPYENVKLNEWNVVGKSNVYYCSRENRNFKTFRGILNDIEFDTIYLNSFFSSLTIKMIIYIKLNNIKNKIVLAPRGEFAISALNIKKVKKLAYINFFKLFINNKHILWHATSNHEKDDINKLFRKSRVEIASNIGSRNSSGIKNIQKKTGDLKIVYVSRIARIKNLDMAIDMLKNVTGNIVYDIYGPKEDTEYWDICKQKISELPNNVSVNYKGKLTHDEIFKTLSDYHVFLLPTQGENFGHAIYEAMSSGCIPIISNKTPWKKLESEQVGWDLDLSNLEEFTQAIQVCVNMNNEDYGIVRKNIGRYIQKVNCKDESVIKMKKLIG